MLTWGALGGVAPVYVEVFGGECCRHGGGGSRPLTTWLGGTFRWERVWKEVSGAPRAAAHCCRNLIGKGAAVRPCSCEKFSTPVLSTQSSPQR